MCKAFDAMHQTFGHYRIARDGQEALDAYKRDPSLCRCILMDVSMPVLDGIRASEMIREFEREKGLEPAIIAGLVAAGPECVKPWPCFDFYLRKPLQKKHVEEALRSRGLLSE